MSSSLSKDLRKKYNVRAVPIRKDDEVEVVRGAQKGRSGRVVACYRSKFAVHVERLTVQKANGQTVNIGFDPSNLVITQLKMDKSRKQLLDRKAAGRGASAANDATMVEDVDE